MGGEGGVVRVRGGSEDACEQKKIGRRESVGEWRWVMCE